MLRTRIITALVLLAILLPVLFLGSLQLGALVALIFVALACWEWMRLLGLPKSQAIGAALFWIALMLIGAWASSERAATAVLAIAALFWVCIAPIWLWRGIPSGLTRSSGPLALLGMVVLGATWWGIVSALANGPIYLLSIMVIVWISDIAAYFCGKAFGRHKLAPSISPGKTWEGVAGALVFVLIIEAAFAILVPPGAATNFTTMLTTRAHAAVMPLVMVVLVALGIVGDLFESLLKRRAGAKDSSHLLPGHGGILDRIDALLPVLPVAMLLDALLVRAPLAN